jgi:hypothetical protein
VVQEKWVWIGYMSGTIDMDTQWRGYESASEAAALEAAAAADSWACTKEVRSAIKMDRRMSTIKIMTESMTAVRDMIF